VLPALGEAIDSGSDLCCLSIGGIGCVSHDWTTVYISVSIHVCISNLLDIREHIDSILARAIC
jgi:hypothetical protein